jgi:hypothetical protein
MNEEFDPKRLLNPNYEQYARMDCWSENEAISLLNGLRPLSEFEWPELITQEDIGDAANELRAIRYAGCVSSLLGGLDEINRHSGLLERAINAGVVKTTGTLSTGDITIHPADFVKWASSKKLKISPKLVRAVKRYHAGDFNESVRQAEPNELQMQALGGEEKRELGIPRQQKVKWETSIEATVEAVLIAQKKKITRAELTQGLHVFDLPFTTLEVIWKSLRERGFTKGAGRPTKEGEKTPNTFIYGNH